jgi:uncharacterized membrane protein YgcG
MSDKEKVARSLDAKRRERGRLLKAIFVVLLLAGIVVAIVAVATHGHFTTQKAPSTPVVTNIGSPGGGSGGGGGGGSGGSDGGDGGSSDSQPGGD